MKHTDLAFYTSDQLHDLSRTAQGTLKGRIRNELRYRRALGRKLADELVASRARAKGQKPAAADGRAS